MSTMKSLPEPLAVGSQVNLGVLGKAFFLPLLLSPVLAVALGATLYL